MSADGSQGPTDGLQKRREMLFAAENRRAVFNDTYPDGIESKGVCVVRLRLDWTELGNNGPALEFEGRPARLAPEALTLFEPGWGLWCPKGQALIEAGLLAKKLGKDSLAQRLFDRGRVEIETFPAPGDAATRLASHMVVEAREELGTVKGWSSSGMLFRVLAGWQEARCRP